MSLQEYRLANSLRARSIKTYAVKSNNGSWSLPLCKKKGLSSEKFFITKPKARYEKKYLEDIAQIAKIVCEYLINEKEKEIPQELHAIVVGLRETDPDIYKRLVQDGYLPTNYCSTLEELSRLYLDDYAQAHPSREADKRRSGNKLPVETRRECHVKMLCAFGYDTRPEHLTTTSVESTLEDLRFKCAEPNPITKKPRKGPWSYRTRRTVFSELLRVMKWGSRKKLIGVNHLAEMSEKDTPFINGEIGSPTNKQVRITLLNDEKYGVDVLEETTRALDCSIVHKTLWMLCLYTGCRFADYKDLLCCDLEFGRLSNGEKTNCWWIYKKIDRKSVAVERQWIMTLPVLSSQLGQYVSWLKAHDKWEDNARVFASITDNHHGWNAQVARDIRQFFVGAGLEIKIEHFGNTLRSTFMDYAQNVVGLSPVVVAQYCGTSVKTVENFYLNDKKRNMRHANQAILDHMKEKDEPEKTTLKMFVPSA